MNVWECLIKDHFQNLVQRWGKYKEQVTCGAWVKATGSLNILYNTTLWCILRLQMVEMPSKYSSKWWIHWIKTLTGGPSDWRLCRELITNLNLKSQQSQCLWTLMFVILIFCNHPFCFDLPLQVLTNWNETMWMVSWLSPLSCYCADHSQGSPVLSPIANECSNASWNETLHQSLQFFFPFKISVFCQKQTVRFYMLSVVIIYFY
jgi:hypothetical protein